MSDDRLFSVTVFRDGTLQVECDQRAVGGIPDVLRLIAESLEDGSTKCAVLR